MPQPISPTKQRQKAKQPIPQVVSSDIFPYLSKSGQHITTAST
jgi:hypothetical protein